MSKLWLLIKVDLKRMLTSKKSKKSSLVTKILGMILICAVFMLYSGIYTYSGLNFLMNYNMQKYIIAVVYLITSFVIFYTTVYRAKSYLFGVDDTIFSMPIKPSIILASKLIALIIVSYLFNFLICMPAFIVYGTTLNLGVMFYISAFIGMLFLPFLPTILGAILGYIIGFFTSKVKKKSLFELVFTYGFMFLIMVIFINIQSIGMAFVNNINDVNNFLSTFGVVINSFMLSITDYNIIQLLIFIVVNILSLILFSVILQKSYIKIVQNLKVIKGNNKKYIGKLHKKKNQFTTMLIREIKFYLSIPIYVFNTSFGAIMILIGAIATFFVDYKSILAMFELQGLNFEIFYMLIPVIIFMTVMTNTTGVSISVEGKNFWILKTLPISIKNIFIAKILLNMLVILPAIFIALIIVIFTLKITIIQALLLSAIATILSLTCSMFGLLVNLKYPRLNFVSYTHVVKQSFSSFLSMMTPMAICIVLIFVYTYFDIPLKLFVAILVALLFVVIVVQYLLLKTWGVKKFKEIN